MVAIDRPIPELRNRASQVISGNGCYILDDRTYHNPTGSPKYKGVEEASYEKLRIVSASYRLHTGDKNAGPSPSE